MLLIIGGSNLKSVRCSVVRVHAGDLPILNTEHLTQVTWVLLSRYCTNMESEKVKTRYKTAHTNQSSNG